MSKYYNVTHVTIECNKCYSTGHCGNREETNIGQVLIYIFAIFIGIIGLIFSLWSQLHLEFFS